MNEIMKKKKLENLAKKKSHKSTFKMFTRNLAQCYYDIAFDNIASY